METSRPLDTLGLRTVVRHLLDRYEDAVAADAPCELAEIERLRTLTTALAVYVLDALPTHTDLRQLVSAVGSLATRVAELEHGARSREDTVHFLTQGLRERTEERDHARRECARLRAELAEERAMADALAGDLCTAREALAAKEGT